VLFIVQLVGIKVNMAIAWYMYNIKFITSPCAVSRLHDLLQFFTCLWLLLVNGVLMWAHKK